MIPTRSNDPALARSLRALLVLPVLPARAGLASLLALALAGCSGATDTTGATATPGTDSSVVDTGHVGVDASTSDAAGDAAADDASAPVDTGSSPDVATPTLPDPNVDGPYAYVEIDSTTNVAASGDNNVPIHCAYPKSGPSAGPYPVVIVGHGLSLPASQYYGYVKRLASFGYVALTVDFPSSPLSVDNPKEAEDLLAGIDWAKNDATVGPKSDTEHVGMTGHSLGGKVALLAATMDARVKASIVLDPVDGGGPTGCTAPSCVIVATQLPTLHIPVGFLGETTDASGGFQPCAPAASNFTTFYAKANAPTFEVTVKGANHMSFLDDSASCGLTCSFCNAATAPNAQVNGIARAYVAAFYERNLRGLTGYDAYLTGSIATSRYVTTGQATITTK